MGEDHWFLTGDEPNMFLKYRFSVHQCDEHIVAHFLSVLLTNLFEWNVEEIFESALEKLGNVESTAQSNYIVQRGDMKISDSRCG